jgi:hypothetical protein
MGPYMFSLTVANYRTWASPPRETPGMDELGANIHLKLCKNVHSNALLPAYKEHHCRGDHDM